MAESLGACLSKGNATGCWPHPKSPKRATKRNQYLISNSFWVDKKKGAYAAPFFGEQEPNGLLGKERFHENLEAFIYGRTGNVHFHRRVVLLQNHAETKVGILGLIQVGRETRGNWQHPC